MASPNSQGCSFRGHTGLRPQSGLFRSWVSWEFRTYSLTVPAARVRNLSWGSCFHPSQVQRAGSLRCPLPLTLEPWAGSPESWACWLIWEDLPGSSSLS